MGWESLSSRRWCRRILQIHKILSNKTPSYLKDKLPRYRRPLYSQEINNTFYEPRCRSQRYMNSFFPDAITSWNNIITYFENIPSYSILKNHLLTLIKPKKKSIFGIHDPQGLRKLFQLRVGLSPLSYHKRCHNFIDTPSDNCFCHQGIEDTKHFLFSCILFVNQRATLIATITEILRKYNLNQLINKENLYLYGNEAIDPVDNNKIILSTIKYIKDTERFSVVD